MTFRYWRRKLLIIFLLFVLIIVLYLNQKRFNNNINNNEIIDEESRSLSSNKLSQIISKLSTIESNLIDIEGGYDQKVIELTELNKCDNCLGNNFCQLFITNSLVINTPYIRNGKVYREAVIKKSNEKLIIMSQMNERWSQLETILCINASMRVPCRQSLAIHNSFMAKSDLFIIDNYRQFFRQIYRTYYAMNDKLNTSFLQPIFSQCATNKYLQLMQTSFDDNNDKYMDLSEQSHLLSSLLAFPGYANHKMLRKIESDLQLANFKGVCGRLIAFDGNYQTLEQFVKDQKNFEVLAGLAVQLIQLIDDLQEEDPNWYLLQTKLTYDSLLVNKDGEIFLADLDDMIIIDKSLFSEQPIRSHPSLLNDEVCNEVCFEKFNQRFLKAFNTSSSSSSPECGQIQKYYGQQMYAMICRNIFSTSDSSSIELNQNSGSSLLRLVPSKDKENVDDLLRECIYETSPGGRKQAIDELRDLLKSYLHFEDNNEDNDNNNEKNNEDDEDNDIDDNEIINNENKDKPKAEKN